MFYPQGKTKAETIRDHAVGDDIVIPYYSGVRVILLSHEAHVCERQGHSEPVTVRKVIKGERIGQYGRAALTWRNGNVGFPIAGQAPHGTWTCSVTKQVCGTPAEARAYARNAKRAAVERKAKEDVTEANRIADVDYVKQVADELGVQVYVQSDWHGAPTSLRIGQVTALLRKERSEA